MILLLAGVLPVTAQVSPELWLGGGIKRALTPKLAAEASMNIRFYEPSLPGTLYPELSLSWKIKDAVKLSADYRAIMDENKYGNYTVANRLNFNVDMRAKFRHFNLGMRVRYQTAFGTLRTVNNYSPEFDQAFRFKPSVTIKLRKKSIFKPVIAGEWFYSPANEVLGDRFTKYRLSAGTEINLKGPREIDIKYIFGRNINLPRQKTEHILSVSYTYEWKKAEADKKK